ncbi:uncharacterized protein LOC118202989 [Stegodyphus dumicola]|uniref:uncharacterized protein LOC118202989 n=1 Tax=Stegodyphus dumicola TaxID=202533 RepID=UPI0015A77255|nr:uncharacterized protein LOC118202989 [Stegodyphus dumicola]
MALDQGRGWGISPYIQKVLYLTVIERMVTYAAAIWAEPMQGRKVRHLQSLQRQFALQITRAFRTTSSSALNVMAGLIPLHLLLQGTGLRIFLKDVTLPPIPSIQYYTDGSKIDQQTGCALVAFHNGQSIYQWLGHLHGNNSVFQAEALAILKAVQHCKTSGAMEAIIITDSLSSLQAIQNPRHSSSLISDIQCELRNQVGNNITLAWTKGHAGDHGNTLADKLAKSAAENTDAEAEEVILKWPTSHLKRALLLKVISQWQLEWDTDETGRRTYNHITYVDQCRQITNHQLVRYISGHGPFPSYFYKHGIANSEYCVCGTLGIPEHYITTCPLTEEFHIPFPVDNQLAFRHCALSRHIPQTSQNIPLTSQSNSPDS